MKVSLRPAKTAVFRYLRRMLRDVDGHVCVDAASGNWKNRDMFKTDAYYGLDVREEVVKVGLEKHASGIGIVGDIRDVAIAEGSVDYVVSTNTLFWLEKDGLLEAIDRFTAWLHGRGVMIVDVRVDGVFDDVLRRLREAFVSVEVTYYRNALSRAFDRIIDRYGHQSRKKFAASHMRLACSYLISFTELLTNRVRSWNSDAVIVCRGKRADVIRCAFTLEGFRRTENDRLYDGRHMPAASGRYVHFKKDIDCDSVRQFFQKRASKYSPFTPEVTTLYQDHNPDLARKRDREEKDILIDMMKPAATDVVLDVGCGIGRWAEALSDRVAAYHGTDMMPELIEIAKERCKGLGNVSFQVLAAEDILDNCEVGRRAYDIVIIAGVLHYVNDDALEGILRGAAAYSRSHSRLIIRGPFAVEKRLTLDHIWSSELNSEYSALYRTLREFRGTLGAVLPEFRIVVDRPLYNSNLNNRAETMQHVFMLQKEH